MNLTLYGIDVWSVALVFARVGAMIMLLPGFGEPAVPGRVRLGFALMMAMAIAPNLTGHIPQPANTAFGMSGQLISEVVIGIALGGASRLLVSSLATAGQIIGMEMGLSFAQTADPTASGSGQLISVFLGLMGIALIFATNLHHMFLMGVVGSYDVIALGAAPPLGDAAQLALETTSKSFLVGFQIATPLVVAGLIFRVGLGFLSRLIPQIQVFFVALPLQMLGGFIILALGISTGMLVWLDSLSSYANWLK